MPDYIHIQRENAQGSYTLLSSLRELFPNGTGYVEVKPNGSLVLSQPSGGGGGGTTTIAGLFTETLTVTATNILPAPSFVPKYADRDFFVTIGSWIRHSITEGSFTVNQSPPSLSISAGAEYDILAGWQVTYEYATDDDTDPPTITATSPASVTVGQVFTITGTGFTNNAVVLLGGQIVPFTLVSQTEISVLIPALLFTGAGVSVETVTGTALASGFNFIVPTPTIAAFTPSAQETGNSVVITGTNFIGVSQVQFGGTNAASFVVNSPTQITAVVGNGASGAVQVTALYGTATRAGFTITATTPSITSFAPTLATAGTDVIITGANFNNTTSVQVNGVTVHSFVVNSATQITARISATNTTGAITVTKPTGTATSANTLTVDQILPFPRGGRLMNANTRIINGRTYIASASNETFGGAFRAFGSGFWQTNQNAPQRVSIQFPFPVKVSRYIIEPTSAFPAQRPISWQLQGSNDGTTWVTLDTRSNVPLTSWVVGVVWDLALTSDYTHYALLVTDMIGTVEIGQLTLEVTL